MFFMDDGNLIMKFLTGITTLYAAFEMVYFIYNAFKGSSNNDDKSLIMIGSQTTITFYTDLVTTKKKPSTEEYSETVQMVLFFSTLVILMMYFDVYQLLLTVGYLFTIYWVIYFGAISINVMRENTTKDLQNGYTQTRVAKYLFSLLIYLIGICVGIYTLIISKNTHAQLFDNIKQISDLNIVDILNLIWNNLLVIYTYISTSPKNMAFMVTFSILSMSILYHSTNYVFKSANKRTRDALVVSSLPKTSPRKREFLKHKKDSYFEIGSHWQFGLMFLALSYLITSPHLLVQFFGKIVELVQPH